MPDPNFLRNRLQRPPRQVRSFRLLKGSLIRTRQLKEAPPRWAWRHARLRIALLLATIRASAGASYDKPPARSPREDLLASFGRRSSPGSGRAAGPRAQ